MSAYNKLTRARGKLFHSPSPSADKASAFRTALTAESLEAIGLKDAVGIPTDFFQDAFSYTGDICSEAMLQGQVKGERSMRK